MRRTLIVTLLILALVPLVAAADNTTNSSTTVSGQGTAGSVPQQASALPRISFSFITQLIQDVIIDLGRGDYIYVITHVLSAQNATSSSVSHFANPAWAALGPPTIDLSQRAHHTIKATDLAAEHGRRKTALQAKQVKQAPQDADLPAFRMNLTSADSLRMSRGTVFSTYLTIYNWTGGHFANGPAAPDYVGRILARDATISTFVNTTKPQKMIVVYKNAADAGLLGGKKYGSLEFTTLMTAQLDTIPHDVNTPIAYVAYDTPMQAHMTLTDADAVVRGVQARQATNLTGAIGICLIDTGIDYTLPRFASNYVTGIDLVNNDADPVDDNGHGTSMADAILTEAPGAQLYVAKALDASGSGYSSTVIQAIDWCMQQDVSVISMSFGGGKYQSWCDGASLLAQKANEAVGRGFLVVAASGNVGFGSMQSPACSSLVTSVGASDANTQPESVWNSSSISNVTDILAPGVNITLLTKGGGSITGSGTSISAALVAGGAAVIEEYTGFAPQQLQDRLRSTGILLASNALLLPRLDLLNAVQDVENGKSLAQDGYQSPYSEDTGTVGTSLPHCIVVCSGTCTSGLACVNTASTDTDLCSFTTSCSGGFCAGWSDIADCTNICNYCEVGTNTTGCVSYPVQHQSSIGSGCQHCAWCDGNGACTSMPGQTEDPGFCDATCKTCNGTGSCGNYPKYTSDAVGTNLCDGSTGCAGATCVCDGTGSCLQNTSSSCTTNGNCVDTFCTLNTYNGTNTSKYCAPDASNCIDYAGVAHATSYDDGKNTCYGNAATGSLWISDQGAWIVKNSSGSWLAAIDKWGSFALRGTSNTLASTFDRGWQVANKSGSVEASINSSNGNLRIRGAGVTAYGTPSGTGFRVQNTTGGIEAIFNYTGSIIVRGPFVTSLPLP